MKGLCELDEVVEQDDLENLLIVDCLNFAFRFKQSGRADFSAKYLNTINSFARSYNAKKVILVADKRNSTFRKNILPTYKGGRAEKFDKQTEEEKQQVKEFFEEYERALELSARQHDLIRMEYVEADDLAAYLVKHVSPRFKHTWLISSDRDWDLLLKDNVSRFSFITRVEYDLDNFYDTHGCDSPEQYISIKAIEGDSGDSVPGVHGWGTKRVYNLLREYGSALDVYDAIPLNKSGVLIDRINKSEDLILKNYELMDLLAFCEDAIGYPDSNNLEFMEKYCNEID